jgi:undecaprenyl-diphosphatase
VAANVTTSVAGLPRRDVRAPRAQWRRAAAQLLAAAALVWLIVCAVGFLLTRPLTDHGFTHWEGGADRYFAAHRVGPLNAITNAASLIGDTPAIVGVAALSFVALRLLTHSWRCSLAVLATMLGEVVIFWFTTIVIDRHRPVVAHLDGSPPTSSFPSGHTAASTSIYGLLAIIVAGHLAQARWRRLVYVVTALLVLSIGISRIYRGMHYPSDVIGGVLLGALWLTATSRVVLRGTRSD